MTPALAALQERLRAGVLAFPVTPFTAALTLDEGTLSRHVAISLPPSR